MVKYYIYSKNIETGEENYVDEKNCWSEAIAAVTGLYMRDTKIHENTGKYYYSIDEIGLA